MLPRNVYNKKLQFSIPTQPLANHNQPHQKSVTFFYRFRTGHGRCGHLLHRRIRIRMRVWVQKSESKTYFARLPMKKILWRTVKYYKTNHQMSFRTELFIEIFFNSYWLFLFILILLYKNKCPNTVTEFVLANHIEVKKLFLLAYWY